MARSVLASELDFLFGYLRQYGQPVLDAQPFDFSVPEVAAIADEFTPCGRQRMLPLRGVQWQRYWSPDPLVHGAFQCIDAGPASNVHPIRKNMYCPTNAAPSAGQHMLYDELAAEALAMESARGRAPGSSGAGHTQGIVH